MLQTNCCPWCFLGCANWETFVADTKCSWTKSETSFVSAANVVCSGKQGNICVGNNVSATMCPRLPGPLGMQWVTGAMHVQRVFSKQCLQFASFTISKMQRWTQNEKYYMTTFECLALMFSITPDSVFFWIMYSMTGEQSLTSVDVNWFLINFSLVSTFMIAGSYFLVALCHWGQASLISWQTHLVLPWIKMLLHLYRTHPTLLRQHPEVMIC